MNINEIISNYKECALWSEDIDATIFDFSTESEATIKNAVTEFVYKSEAALIKSGLTPAEIGHSLWLTQNRHGAGFFDYNIDSDIIDQLTEAAQSLGEKTIFINEGKVIIE